MMLAGFSQIDITPPIGTAMPGQMVPYITEEEAATPLYSTAAAFTSGGQSVILISMDVLSSKAEYVNSIRARIREATGVPENQILVAATHTHTGPVVGYQLWLCPPDKKIAGETADKTVQAAVEAWNNRTPCTLSGGKCTEERFSFCRDFILADRTVRTNPGAVPHEDLVRTLASGIDRSVNVLRVDDEAGKIQCFIVNYANHPDNVWGGGKRNRFCADFPGYLRQGLKETYGEEVKVLFFNGTAGDVCCVDYLNKSHKWYFGKNVQTPETIGRGLAEDVIALNAEMQTAQPAPVIAVVSGSVTTSRRFKSQADYEWALEMSKKDPATLNEVELAFTADYLESDEGIPPTVELEVQTIRLGDWALVCLPSEIFSEIGLAIKAASPFENTMVVELANGTNGYIPPDYVMDTAAYEAKISKYNSYCGKGTAEKLIRQSIRQLYALSEC